MAFQNEVSSIAGFPTGHKINQQPRRQFPLLSWPVTLFWPLEMQHGAIPCFMALFQSQSSGTRFHYRSW